MSISQAVVIVEDHDGADHAAGHHDHDAGEVSTNQRSLAGGRLHVRDLCSIGILKRNSYNLPTMFMKKVSDINTVISNVTFSPESGGKLNPNTAIL